MATMHMIEYAVDQSSQARKIHSCTSTLVRTEHVDRSNRIIVKLKGLTLINSFQPAH